MLVNISNEKVNNSMDHCCTTSKVTRWISLLEQPTIDCVPTAYWHMVIWKIDVLVNFITAENLLKFLALVIFFCELYSIQQAT